MIIDIEHDYDNSTNKKVRYLVRDSGYLIKDNLSRTQAKKLKKLIIRSKNTRISLSRQFGVKE